VANFQFKLFVAGDGARSERTVANLRRLCDEVLGGDCDVAVIDVLEQPQLAEEFKILGTPTLIKLLPPPVVRIIGDLSLGDRVLRALELPRRRNPGTRNPGSSDAGSSDAHSDTGYEEGEGGGE
jgi:circadian clock protein KaiB